MTRCHHSDARLSGHCLGSKLTFKVAVQAQESFQRSLPAQLEGMMSQTGKPPTDSSVGSWICLRGFIPIQKPVGMLPHHPGCSGDPGALDNLVKSSDPGFLHHNHPTVNNVHESIAVGEYLPPCDPLASLIQASHLSDSQIIGNLLSSVQKQTLPLIMHSVRAGISSPSLRQSEATPMHGCQM